MISNKEASPTSIIERQASNLPPRTLRSWVIGRPLSTADAPHQTIGKAVGLAVFASDALSSTAYATQEILGVIAIAGTVAYGYLFPISLAIVTLLIIVTISYEQTIHAYPGGGGAYIVARDNLGELPAQTAGAAMGSVFAPTKIIVGATTAGMTGKEGIILRSMLLYVAIMIAGLSLATVLLMGIWPR